MEHHLQGPGVACHSSVKRGHAWTPGTNLLRNPWSKQPQKKAPQDLSLTRSPLTNLQTQMTAKTTFKEDYSTKGNPS